MNYSQLLELWLKNATQDPDLISELESVRDNAAEVEDRFYRELEFGTGGLRGVIGAGCNRMNIYTVARATQGLSQYINAAFTQPSVAIAYDSRIKSELFAKTAAGVFAANGIKVYIYSELMPTPMLSYAVRALHCSAGIVVTASHNPSKYNGYKVYGEDGCQLTLEASSRVLENIESIDVFTGVRRADFDECVAAGSVEYIEQSVIDSYLDAVREQSVNPDALENCDFSVVYTPLHGSGNKPVRAILKRVGIENVTVVRSQELPDGNFPTAPYPNPEIREAFEEALKVAREVQPDILLATDPDCDRVGIAVRREGEYVLMSGNEVGVLLLNYILHYRAKLGTLVKNPVAVKTIVTTDLAARVAQAAGCEIRNVLTGFKFIGEQIGMLEAAGEQQRYVFGFEESYGYLAGGYVRDKDAVVGSMLICEMAAVYKKQGKTLLDVMEELYSEYGRYLHRQISFSYEGMSGMQKMSEIMNGLRQSPPSEIAGLRVLTVNDYERSLSTDAMTGQSTKLTLPRSNVIAFMLENDASAVVRPSGTEPKMKIYLTAVGSGAQQTESLMTALADDMSAIINR